MRTRSTSPCTAPRTCPASCPRASRSPAVPAGEDPRDALVGAPSLDALPEGARVGTSSLRRRSQLLAQRADVEVVPLRGNVDTRLRKLAEGECDAALLALAGLRRLGREARPARRSTRPRSCRLPDRGSWRSRPGPAARPASCSRRSRTRSPAQRLDAERAVVETLDTSCHTPVGAHAVVAGDRIEVHAYAGLPDGTEWITDRLVGRCIRSRRGRLRAGAPDAGRGRGRAAAQGGRYARRMSPDPGIVYLVGAGPGDPGLATVRAAELIARADVILYDRLVSPRLLDGARADTELAYVGKEAGGHTMTQEEINRLLVAHAQEGRTVVRLKGGDPFVFGRGGEEAEALAEAGVPFEVVPGVTAGVAAPAYAGIPVTHRDQASAVAFVTAHEDPAKHESAIDWAALAAFPGTLVFYMGVRVAAAASTAALQRHGRDAGRARGGRGARHAAAASAP